MILPPPTSYRPWSPADHAEGAANLANLTCPADSVQRLVRPWPVPDRTVRRSAQTIACERR
jgi:hypothetical protein